MPEYIVRLEDGVWLADGDGDPPRTARRELAKRFVNFEDADVAIESARQYRPFRWAAVEAADGPAISAARSATDTLIAAMRILSRDIRSTDGIANAAVAEAAERLAELAGELQAANRRAESAECLLDALRKADAVRAEKLRALSTKWKDRSFEEEHDWYNDCSSINQFTEELDEILEET